VGAKPFELEVNRALPKILVASEYMKGELVKNKFDAEKIVVMPQPIDASEAYDLEYGDFILFVGRLTVEKGLKYLLQAMIKTPSEIKLKVVGDGPERVEDQELAVSLGLSDRVNFTGWIPYQEICPLYAHCRFLVFPSVWPEPYGRTGPEAMLFEKPVVGFRVGAVPEWLKDNENGFLVEPRDVNGLAEKISRLWNDLELTKKLGQKGKEFIIRHTDSENYIQKLEELFDTIRGNELLNC
jgi:glycosyltransferase involved in cell wall biosynthesis